MQADSLVLLSLASPLCAHQVFSGPDPDPQIEFQAWFQTYFLTVLLIWTGQAWLPFLCQICSLAAPHEPLLFPPLFPEGAAGLVAQAYFLCQCELRCAVPVLKGCWPPSSSTGAQSSSSRKHSPWRDPWAAPLSVPLNQLGTETPEFCASSNLGKVSKLVPVSWL